MSRETKRQAFWFQVDDTEAIARHLEKMEAKGWKLEAVDNWYYHFRRSGPAQVRYAVTYFPDASVFDPKLPEGQETYAGYCEAAGWELAAAYGPIQYFRSTRADPTPIETDESIKLDAVRRTMRKTYVLSYAAMLLIPLVYFPAFFAIYWRDPMDFFSSTSQILTLLMMVHCPVWHSDAAGLSGLGPAVQTVYHAGRRVREAPHQSQIVGQRRGNDPMYPIVREPHFSEEQRKNILCIVHCGLWRHDAFSPLGVEEAQTAQ